MAGIWKWYLNTVSQPTNCLSTFSLSGSVCAQKNLIVRQSLLHGMGSAGLRNDLYCVEWDVKLYYTILMGSTFLADSR